MNKSIQEAIQKGKERLQINQEGDLMSSSWSSERILANEWVEKELPQLLEDGISSGCYHVLLGDPDLKEKSSDMYPEDSFTSREIKGVKVHSKIIAAACGEAGLPVRKHLFGVIRSSSHPFMNAWNDYYIDIKAL